jgi:hypothetical protein
VLAVAIKPPSTSRARLTAKHPPPRAGSRHADCTIQWGTTRASDIAAPLRLVSRMLKLSAANPWTDNKKPAGLKPAGL